MKTNSLQVTHIRNSSPRRKIHRSQPRGHVLLVAFNNIIAAGEKHFDGRPLLVASGRMVAQTLYLPAGSELKGWSTGQVDFLKIEISCEVLKAAAEESGGTLAPTLRPVTPFNDPTIWHLACILRADMEQGAPGGVLLRDTVQSLLAHHLAAPGANFRRSGALPSGALAPARLRAVREYISAYLHREIRLVELATIAGLSLFHFTRAFKVTIGKSPYQYVLEQRLEAACRLLEGTRLSVEEVGLATGFQTGSGFAASFRRKCGLTPSAYRRAVGVAL